MSKSIPTDPAFYKRPTIAERADAMTGENDARPISNGADEATNIRPGKRWYIAGPMRGMDRLNRPAFYEAAAKLRKHGHQAVNPFELEMAEDKPILDYMKVDLPALLECDGVALLPGWEKSQGARLEALVGFECGLDVRTIHCAVWHGFLDAAGEGVEMLDVHCVVTKADVLKAMGTQVPDPSYLTKDDAAAAEKVMRGMRDSMLRAVGEAPKPKENILEEAMRLTSRDRQGDYGHPADHFQRTISAINAIFKDKLKEPFEVMDWPLILVLDKVSRQSNKHKRDNLTDIAGYARTAEMIHDRNEEVRP